MAGLVELGLSLAGYTLCFALLKGIAALSFFLIGADLWLRSTTLATGRPAKKEK